jgi:hypothetical protein|tara:strand:+ start:1358 stop:1726 length:369 start_codon:yes stop_codon:yes gene_type:complete
MDIFTRGDQIRQTRADSDMLFAYLFGHKDMSTVMNDIIQNLPPNIPVDMVATLKKASTHNTRLPQLFVLLFGIWTKSVHVQSCPMRNEKFTKQLDIECMKMLTGEYVNINEFITNTLTEYLI